VIFNNTNNTLIDYAGINIHYDISIFQPDILFIISIFCNHSEL